MEFYLVDRKTAKKAYRDGYQIHIGTFSKKYGGGWWPIETFVPNDFEACTGIAFESAASYFRLNYGMGYRTSYAIEKTSPAVK